MENRKVTLKDIAQKSGYSLVTVHRVINHKDGVSKEAQKKILELAGEMGYTANYVASALKRKQVNIAVLLPEEEKNSKYYFHYIWKGCEEAAKEVEGYNIYTIRRTFSIKGREGGKRQAEALRELYEEWGEQLDGLLTTPTSDSVQIQCFLSLFAGKGVAVVLIDNDFKDCGRLCCVSPNDVYTGRLAAELLGLVLKGKKGTVLVAQGDKHSMSHEMNEEGFRKYLEGMEPDLRLQYVEDTGDFFLKERKQMLNLFRDDRSIIAAYAIRARNTLPMCEAFLESGRDDVFLVGSDLFPGSARMLNEGVLKAIVYKNPYQKGYMGYWTLFEYLIKNKTPEKDAISVGISIILQNNIRFFEDFI